MAISPQQPVGKKPDDPTAIVDDVTCSLRATAEELVPWFLEQMPLMYFQDTDRNTQLAHLRSIIAAKASGRPIPSIMQMISLVSSSSTMKSM